VTEPAGAFKRLKALGADAMAEIDERLSQGQTPTAVTKWMQSEKNWLPDMKEGSLKKTLDRYLQKEVRPRALARLSEANRKVPLAAVQKRMNAMERLADLVDTQALRLDKVLKREKDLPAGMLLGDVKHEARLLKDMLVDLGRLQIETGVLARAPRRMTGTLLNPNGEVTEFTWTEEAEQLYAEIGAEYRVLGDVDKEAK
jgi:hypothetical protein